METRNTKHETRNGAPARRRNVLEIVAIALMLVGIGMVCQPFFHVLFRNGFPVTLAGIVLFTVASHRSRGGS